MSLELPHYRAAKRDSTKPSAVIPLGLFLLSSVIEKPAQDCYCAYLMKYKRIEWAAESKGLRVILGLRAVHVKI